MSIRRLTRRALAQSTIVVADDVLTNRVLIAAILARAGFGRVLLASGGQAALDIVRREQPDLLLLDLLMPDPDGFAVCRELRKDERFDDLPIVAMTALEDPEERALAFAAGATDLILKPIHEAELIGRAHTHLECRLMITGLREFNARTAAELVTAGNMQKALLPAPSDISRIAELHGVAAAAVFTPSAELGGDLWGLWSIDATRFGIYMLDVSGHGTIAAINTFRIHTMVRDDIERDNAGRFLADVNERLVPLLAPGQFATMIYAVMDTARDLITYAAAGSPAPLLAAPGAAPVYLDGSGVPIGIEPGITYATRRAPFVRGTRLMFYSDAVTEAPLRHGGRLGDAKADALITAALACRTPEEAVTDLGRRISAATGGALNDDLTLVCLERKP